MQKWVCVFHRVPFSSSIISGFVLQYLQPLESPRVDDIAIGYLHLLMCRNHALTSKLNVCGEVGQEVHTRR